MNDLFAADADLINKEEISGRIDNTPEGVPSIFKPWHKPRKQWVRDMQWWEHLERLLRVKPAVTTLRYFGLPGGDLLDVEYIRRKLAASGKYADKKILLHGFIDNEEDKASADSRLSELLDSNNIDERSRVDRFNFSSLQNETAAGWSRIKDVGPYHWVNLDFCDCALQEKTIDSLLGFMNFQLTRQIGVPWLFCITTRVDRTGVNKDVFSRLDGVLDGLQGDDDVLAAIKDCFDEACGAIEENLNFSTDGTTGPAFSELLQVCFVLWVITYSLSHETEVKLVSSMKYAVNEGNESPDMCSFVFRLFKRDVVLPDAMGLAIPMGALQVAISLEDQIAMKTASILKLAESMDVDKHLSENDDDMQKYAEEMRRLLAASGWDVTNYYQEFCPELA